jgi:hypothetical protein
VCRTILKTPFVPFTTVFSHVLKTYDRVDLERLQQFAESMSDSPTSKPAYKVSRLASVFVSVATAYVESKERDARNERIEQPNPASLTSLDYTSAGLYQHTATDQMPIWAPIDPLIHALGFAEDQPGNMNGSSGANVSLENWFNGNQHIMGLLEDDLSYLDTATLTF